MKILALDTATEACSAALYLDGEIKSVYELAPRAHTQLILPMIKELLDDSGLSLSELDALSYAHGPGAFTGIRIAAGVVQGLSYADDLPVVPVSTLAAIAQEVINTQLSDTVLTAIDARMGEIYWGLYQNDNGLAHLAGAEKVTRSELLDIDPASLKGLISGAGTGWTAYRDELSTRFNLPTEQVFDQALPKASAIAQLAAFGFENGRAVSAHQAQPVYLRDNVAKKRSEQGKPV